MLFWETSLLTKLFYGLVFGNFRKSLGYNLFQHLVTLIGLTFVPLEALLVSSGWFMILTRCWWGASWSLSLWRSWRRTRRFRRLWWWLILLFSSNVTSVHEQEERSSPSLPMTRSPGIGDSIGDSDRTRKVEWLMGSSWKFLEQIMKQHWSMLVAVRAYHPTVLGSNPKHTIYAFYWQSPYLSQ